MNVIYPFRNIKAAKEQEICNICGEEIARVDAYSVVTDNHISDYVCSDCYLMFIDQDRMKKAN